eukprot:Gregarina_sp_Poly_1__7556@NODE_422_length_8655_cov_206_021076_g344_i0_p12_GENE_NODE_422_length_8655_cov_206_021076_g344_i0NODE_422_length_8655_cov_206_021076_g344_i0_p12_ORF_typecomplete_len109_score12_43_NODE_422_length_8655_cov_206_021076_g344_i038604186
MNKGLPGCFLHFHILWTSRRVCLNTAHRGRCREKLIFVRKELLREEDEEDVIDGIDDSASPSPPKSVPKGVFAQTRQLNILGGAHALETSPKSTILVQFRKSNPSHDR